MSAVVVCWPAVYTETLGLKGCRVPGANSDAAQARPFTLVPYTGADVKYDVANRATEILVFYRPPRQNDAERLVGALQAAGFLAPDGVTSDLNEVVADNRGPGVSLIKTTAAARPLTPEVLRISQIALSASAASISIYPTDTQLSRGAIQVDLF